MKLFAVSMFIIGCILLNFSEPLALFGLDFVSWLGYCVLAGLAISASIRFNGLKPTGKLALVIFLILLSLYFEKQLVKIYMIAPLLILLMAGRAKCSLSITGDIRYLGRIILSAMYVLFALLSWSVGMDIFLLRFNNILDPNFFAASFLLLLIPIIYGSLRQRTFAIILLAVVVMATLSRALLITLAFIFLFGYVAKRYWTSFGKILSIAIILGTIFYPFMLGDKIETKSEGALDHTRLISLSDQSVTGRLEEIVLAEKYIARQQLFLWGDGGLYAGRKPHNWFWTLSLNHGYLFSITVLLSLALILTRANSDARLFMSALLIFSGFLDNVILWPIFYIIALFSIKGCHPTRFCANFDSNARSRQ